ncbi:hypothetical protein CU048_08875 [Beijerinckiaceae bacterium]|nr:hypothetical protein CU048_08875 [Beijerinckiaceae bacterium]
MNETTLKTQKPNLFELSGYGLQVTYSLSSFEGPPQFNFHDATQSKLFKGDQIRTVETELGTLVSVTINLTVDSGSTTFTLVVPSVNLRGTESVQIETVGITTLHKTSIIGPPNGQTDFYTVQALRGTAAKVAF